MPKRVPARRARAVSTCPVCHAKIMGGMFILPDFESREHAHKACVIEKMKARVTV